MSADPAFKSSRVMDQTYKFVNLQNVDRFFGLLDSEENPRQRETLRQILVEEEDRYGFFVEQLDMARRHLRAGEERIDRLRTQIARERSEGKETAEYEKLLTDFLDTHACFKQFEARILNGLKKT